jgi:hypothetical protein
MTVRELSDICGFEVHSLCDAERSIDGAYVGDLLSWVMGRAEFNDAWITIMSNVNVIAVATLSDVSCVILAEGVRPDAELIEVARAKGVNLLSSPHPTYETAVKISELIR